MSLVVTRPSEKGQNLFDGTSKNQVPHLCFHVSECSKQVCLEILGACAFLQ